MCYSPVDAQQGQVIFHSLPRFYLERVRCTLTTYAFSKTCISRNVLNGAGRTHRNRAIVHKQLARFSDFNAGLIISENDQNDLVKIFFMTQNTSKRPTRVLFASTYTSKQMKTMYYSLTVFTCELLYLCAVTNPPVHFQRCNCGRLVIYSGVC